MNADDLSRVVMSATLATALSRARENARAQGHGEVTLEHMLMALCEDPDAGLVLAASNVDVMKLKSDASRYLVSLERQAFAGRATDPGVSADLRRILDAAAAAARGGRRREINGAIVLAAIIGDGKSPASHMLQSQGLTFEGAIRALQRGAGVNRPQTSTEDILASARERVQSRSVPVGMKPEEDVVEEDDEEPYEAPAEAAAVPDYDDVPPTAPPRPTPPQPASARASPPRPAPAKRPEPRPELREEIREVVARPAPAPAPMPVREAEPEPEPLPPMAYDDEQMSAPLDDFDGYAPAQPMAAPPSPKLPGVEPAPSWTPDPAEPVTRTVPPPLPGQAPPLPGQAARAPEPMRGDEMFALRRGPDPAEPPPKSRLSELREPRRPEGIGAASSGMESPAYQALARARQVPTPTLAPGPASAPRQATRPAPAPRAEIGQLVENIPRSMRVAVQALIEVRIARAEVQSLAEGLQGGGAAYKHEVTVTRAMSVRLRAPDGGFFIETASPETQWIEKTSLISTDDYASWRWHVTPREKGRRRLQLIISARTVSGDGLAAETALPDQVISVRVRTNYGRSFSRLIGWSVAAVAGGLIAKFGEGALDQMTQIVTRLMKG
jgi:neural Wiskott-Aldrich syndrome protein